MKACSGLPKVLQWACFYLKRHCGISGKNKKAAMSKNRTDRRYRKHWDELIDRYGRTCFYCREEIAVTIDHVIPWDWDNDNNIENLVPACVLCNALASDKIFDDVERKRQYILGQRKSRKLRRTICTDCLLPYAYLEHSPSLFLCAECYDDNYKTDHAKDKRWLFWLRICELAGIFPEAHRKFRNLNIKYRPKDRKAKYQKLIDLYNEYQNTHS